MHQNPNKPKARTRGDRSHTPQCLTQLWLDRFSITSTWIGSFRYDVPLDWPFPRLWCELWLVLFSPDGRPLFRHVDPLFRGRNLCQRQTGVLTRMSQWTWRAISHSRTWKAPRLIDLSLCIVFGENSVRFVEAQSEAFLFLALSLLGSLSQSYTVLGWPPVWFLGFTEMTVLYWIILAFKSVMHCIVVFRLTWNHIWLKSV